MENPPWPGALSLGSSKVALLISSRVKSFSNQEAVRVEMDFPDWNQAAVEEFPIYKDV